MGHKCSYWCVCRSQLSSRTTFEHVDVGASLIRLSDPVELARDHIEKPTSNITKYVGIIAESNSQASEIVSGPKPSVVRKRKHGAHLQQLSTPVCGRHQSVSSIGCAFQTMCGDPEAFSGSTLGFIMVCPVCLTVEQKRRKSWKVKFG